MYQIVLIRRISVFVCRFTERFRDMFDFSILISNPLINVAVVSWCAAQILKTSIHLFKHGEFKKERLSGAGGHAKLPLGGNVLGAADLLPHLRLFLPNLRHGVRAGTHRHVRRDRRALGGGLHAKAINYIVEYLGDENTKDKDQLKEMIPKLNESLGHRMIEVVCGALLGFAISLIGYFCF